jgi:hypothetical protein
MAGGTSGLACCSGGKGGKTGGDGIGEGSVWPTAVFPNTIRHVSAADKITHSPRTFMGITPRKAPGNTRLAPLPRAVQAGHYPNPGREISNGRGL